MSSNSEKRWVGYDHCRQSIHRCMCHSVRFHSLVGFVIAIFFGKDVSIPIDLRNINAMITRNQDIKQTPDP